jgi:hypothetical protein
VRKFDSSRYRDYFDKQNIRGDAFDEHVPALRFGENLRGKQGANARWEDVESDMRSRWEKERPGTFDKFKDSIRHAWSKKD